MDAHRVRRLVLPRPHRLHPRAAERGLPAPTLGSLARAAFDGSVSTSGREYLRLCARQSRMVEQSAVQLTIGAGDGLVEYRCQRRPRCEASQDP